MNEDSQFNNTREGNGVKNYASRKQNSSYKYSDNKGNRYSPSASYNYNGQSRATNNFQQPRRRAERYKKDTGGSGSSEKLIKQNDTIIRLLKEIRDGIAGLINTSTTMQNENIDHAVNDSQNFSNEDKPVVSSKMAESTIEVPENTTPPSEPPVTADTQATSNTDESLDDLQSTESQPEEKSPIIQPEKNSSKEPRKKASSKA